MPSACAAMATRPPCSAHIARRKPWSTDPSTCSLGHDDVEIEIHAAEPAHAERVGARRARDAGRVHRHEKRRDALSAQPGPRRREHDDDGRRVGVGDPDLAAGDVIAGGHASRPSSAGWRRRCPRRAPTARRRRSPRRSPACAASAPSGARVPACARSSATSELVTDSDTATVALARATASMASA